MERQLDSTGRPRFDLALTMAGAVSAGAYTAGVLDFLIEALDAWEEGKMTRDPFAPEHGVCLRALSGASAGAITGAVLGACLKYDFAHYRQGRSGDGSDNPLYHAWVNQVSIYDLLQLQDLADSSRPISLLDSSKLLDVARTAINYGHRANTRTRSYLSDPLRFIFTVTNLRGVPFGLEMGGSSYHHAMTMHGDTMRFALAGLGEQPGAGVRDCEYLLEYPGNGEKWGGEWERFALASLASAAFPVGLAPRQLTRRTRDYQRLPIVVPGGTTEAARTITISPCWSVRNPNPGEQYSFVNVDGGTIDNEPLELARIELAGGNPLARNERDGRHADRAVIMVDPFVGLEPSGPSNMTDFSLIDGLISTFGALKNQARFRPQDLALAMEDTIYSRFLIAPSRKDRNGEDSSSSIACGSLGGFGGFLDIAFRRHDFFLGRRNCQRFLQKHLVLPAANPLFVDWTVEQKIQFGFEGKTSSGPEQMLPIIPLMPAINPRISPRAEEREPKWPVGVFDPVWLETPVRRRLDGLFHAMAHEEKWDQRLRGMLFSLGWKYYARPKVTKKIVAMVREKLREHQLL